MNIRPACIPKKGRRPAFFRGFPPSVCPAFQQKEYAIENVRNPIYRKNHTICPDNTSYTPKINDKGTRNMGIK